MKRNFLIWLLIALLTVTVICTASCDTVGDGSDPVEDSTADTETTTVAADGTPSDDTVADTDGHEASNKAPDFAVIGGDGNSVRLSDFVGKPVVLNFWASWCPPCKAEMPDFEAMYKEYGDRVAFVIVNMTDGSRETVETAKAHIADNGYTFPVYFDTDFEGANAYYVTSIPATYFIDAEGNVVSYVKHKIDGETLKNGIEMILGEAS